MPTSRSSPAAHGVARRAVLAGMASLAALPASAAHLALGADAWVAYEARLRARLIDAGGGRFDAASARRILNLTNRARAAVGVPACRWSDELALTARAHAADLAGRGYIEHLTPEGFDPTHRIGVLARRMIGSASENIAYRQSADPPSAEDLMGIWRNSEHHWLNLLNLGHAQAGFGVAVRGERTYAVGLYAAPDGELAAPLPFKVEGVAELSSALAQASPRIESFALTDPLDEAANIFAARETAGPGLTPGVYQLRPRRRVDQRRYEVLWGPIFVRV